MRIVLFMNWMNVILGKKLFLREAKKDVGYLDSIQALKDRIAALETIIHENQESLKDLKAKFLQNVYHEIRTPLNAILGFTSIIEQNGLNEKEYKKYSEYVKRSSDEFLAVIDNLVEASLIESNHIDIKQKEFDLEDLFKELHSYFTVRKHVHGKENIALLNKMPLQEEKHSIYTDRSKLFQVFSNLLSNSFKFTEKGVIEFGIESITLDSYVFFVADSGKGGLKNKEIIAFENFTKLRNEGSPNLNGLGLGLSISKKIIEILGGSIWIESNKFDGTTIKFTLSVKSKSEKDKIKELQKSEDSVFYPRIKKTANFR